MSPRLVVVTGATRGLGRALAAGFAGRGWTVAGCGRSGERVDELGRELPAPHFFRVLDVASEGVEEWAREVVERAGAPDLLINNAGLINQVADLWRVPRREFFELLEVNVGGVYAVCRSFLPAMIERGRGVVVNMSSGWGRSVAAGVAPYCATKWAVEGLTRALAEELPAGLAAVPLNPGVIDTDMLRTAWAGGAAAHPKPAAWAERAVPFLEKLGPESNGRPLTVP